MLNHYNSIFEEEFRMFIKAKRASGLKYIQEHQLLKIDTFLVAINLEEKIITKETFDTIMSSFADKSTNIQAAYYTVMKSFCEYITNLGYTNIYIGERNFKRSRVRSPVSFTDTQILRIFSEMDKVMEKPRNQKYYRIYFSYCIIVRLLYACGLRISEAVSITYEDINIDLQTIHIINSKRNISRMIVFSDSMKYCLSKYLYTFNITKGNLFFNMYNNCISPRSVLKFYKRILSDLEYDTSARLHDLRHQFVNEAFHKMVSQGYNEKVVLLYLHRYLGHNSIIETEYYFHFIDKDRKYIIESNQTYSQYLYGEIVENES